MIFVLFLLSGGSLSGVELARRTKRGIYLVGGERFVRHPSEKGEKDFEKIHFEVDYLFAVTQDGLLQEYLDSVAGGGGIVLQVFRYPTPIFLTVFIVASCVSSFGAIGQHDAMGGNP